MWAILGAGQRSGEGVVRRDGRPKRENGQQHFHNNFEGLQVF